jgi:D-amino peptidase
MLRRKDASIDHYDRRTFFRLASAALAAPALVHGGQGGAVAGARDWRRVAISVDMEGATGVVAEEETNQTTEEYRAARRWMLSDVNAAVEGALDAGATYIEVHDTHNISKRNIPFEDLHPKAHLVRGGNTYFWNYDALDSSFGAALLVGMHAGPLQPGILSHYFSLQFREVRINNQPVTESHMTVALASHFGVPSVMVTGDDQICNVVRDWSKGQIETVVTKRALSWRSAVVASLADTHERIRATAARALKRAPDAPLLRFTEPMSVQVELNTAEQAKLFALIPTVKYDGVRTVVFTSANALEAHKTLVAAVLMLLSLPGA